MLSKLSRNKALLFICDVQENFMPKTYRYEGALEAILLVQKIAKVFEIPVIIT